MAMLAVIPGINEFMIEVGFQLVPEHRLKEIPIYWYNLELFFMQHLVECNICNLLKIIIIIDTTHNSYLNRF